MSIKSFITFLSIGVIASIFFLLYPGIDMHTSRYFYHPGSGFIWEHAQGVRYFRQTLYLLLWLFVAACVIWLIASLIWPKLKAKIHPVICLYLLLCLAIGPGLVVNGIFKNHWGRPRPRQIQAFGGQMHFEPAWVISDQCPTNCSFVCGDASIGYFLFAFVPLVRRKKLMMTTAVIAGLGLGVMRIAMGGHFLSDVILSGVINFLCIYFVYWCFQRFSPAVFAQQRLIRQA